MNITKLFVLPTCNNSAPVRLLREVYPWIARVNAAHEADFMIVPQALRRLDTPTKQYLEEMKTLAKDARKQLLVFWGHDEFHDAHIEDVVLFVRSNYGRTKHSNEISLVPYIEDLTQQAPFVPRVKSSRPVVAFCGFAGFRSPATFLKYVVANAMIDVRSAMGDVHAEVYKRGVYWRRQAMRILRRDSRIDTRFIVRTSFLGGASKDDPSLRRVREEYVENMRDADFVLTPKGDGNYSDRFFETLSVGRIPVLIDTDMVLPLEKQIDYSKFIIRVPYTDSNRIDSYIADRFSALSNDEFVGMQIAAREAFEQYLRFDSYFNIVFEQLRKGRLGDI